MFYYFYDTPFSAGTQLDQIDVYTGNGVQTEFVLVNKTIGKLGSTVVFNSTQYAQYNNTLTKNIASGSFITSSAPANGSLGVAPGISALTGAAYDTDNVDGETNPREVEVPFWYGDPYNINQYAYLGFPSDAGIGISFVSQTSGFGAQASWCQLSCASPSGGVLGYGATGETLWVAPLIVYGTLAASSAAAASSIMCGNASSFTAGDYIVFNQGAPNFEICRIDSINGPGYQLNIGLGGPNFSHSAGEQIFVALRKGWAKFTIPLNQTNGTAANYYNLGFRRKGRIIARP